MTDSVGNAITSESLIGSSGYSQVAMVANHLIVDGNLGEVINMEGVEVVVSSEGVSSHKTTNGGSQRRVYILQDSSGNLTNTVHILNNSHEQDMSHDQVVEYGENIPETTIDSVIPEGSVCLVCGDRGSGFHYSVFSCEGCKGFFKRTVQRNMFYMCKENNDCVVNKTTRNNCQYCRFKKCLIVGMKKEAVREDRTPGGKNRQKKARLEDGGFPPVMQGGGDGSPPTQYLLSIRGGRGGEGDDELLQRLTDSRPDLIPGPDDVGIGGEESVSTNGVEDAQRLSVQDLMQFGYMELRLIIEWARKVPGFTELQSEDQMALLKASFMELNILRLAFRSLDTPGYVKFASHLCVSPRQIEYVGWGRDLINCTLEFVGRIRDIDIDVAEFSILCAVVLTYPDAAGVQDKASVSSLQNVMLECLQRYSTSRYPERPHRYGKILLRLPALRTVSARAAEKFLTVSLDTNVRMNELVLEMMN